MQYSTQSYSGEGSASSGGNENVDGKSLFTTGAHLSSFHRGGDGGDGCTVVVRVVVMVVVAVIVVLAVIMVVVVVVVVVLGGDDGSGDDGGSVGVCLPLDRSGRTPLG